MATLPGTAMDDAMNDYAKARKPKKIGYGDIAVAPGDLKPILPNIRGETYPPPQPQPSGNPLAALNTLIPPDEVAMQYLKRAAMAPATAAPVTPQASAPTAAAPSPAAPINAPPQRDQTVTDPRLQLTQDKYRASAEFDDMMRNKYLRQKQAQYQGMGLSPGANAAMEGEIAGANAVAAKRHMIQAGDDSRLSGTMGDAAAAEYARRRAPFETADKVGGLDRQGEVLAREAENAQLERTARAAKELPLQNPMDQLAAAKVGAEIKNVNRAADMAERDQPYIERSQSVERVKAANAIPYQSAIQGIATGIGNLNGKYINSEEESSQWQALSDAYQTFTQLPRAVQPHAAAEILSLLQSKGIGAPVDNSAGSTMLSRGIQSLGRAIPSMAEGRSKGEADAHTKRKDDDIKAMFNNLRYMAGLAGAGA